ncbi:hypothetical protein MMC29_004925, partial [Sticta canariensis]|nr:hypothetical protein [Sticta canariensis]
MSILLLYNYLNLCLHLQHPEATKVAVVNQVGFHNEVYSALIWSFQRAGANVTAFVDTMSTWQIEEVLKS